MVAKFLAGQLSNPSGIFGRLILAPLWNRRNSALNDAVFDSLDLRPHDRVLEVGFGGGYLLGRMLKVAADGFFAGVDISPEMVAFCERRYRPLVAAGRLELKCAKAEALPYEAAYFNKACTVNSIFYWEDAQRAISEMWRVLEEDGRLVICFTCKECLEDKSFARHGVATYEAEEVRQMLQSAGFREIGTARLSDRHRKFWRVTGRK